MAATLFGYAINSDLPLIRTADGPGERGVLRVRRSHSDLRAREGELVSWDELDGIEFALATSGPDLLVWCSATGSYLIRGDELLTCPAGHPNDWEHRIGSTILPLMLTERGDLALHAAAVVEGGEAILFCGPAGRGKSTLAAALALRGYEVLSDDGVVLSGLEDQPMAWPGATGVRITPTAFAALAGRGQDCERGSSYKATHLIGRAPSTAARSVAAVVLLAPREGKEPEADRLEPMAAQPALMPHVLHGGPDRLAAAMRRTGLLVSRVPVFRARLPQHLEDAGAHAEMLLGRLQDSPY